MNDIKIWAQMFFEDGSVSQGVRIPAEWLEEDYKEILAKTAQNILADLNRDEGWMLIWGAGNMIFNHYPTAFFPSGSDSSALEP